ncbi:hypothetical protein [Ancylobacter rudongensis]|uniref:Uncharacterized protein n=1 Tax=Ancylobacter rudongensis TaxID=177413 RepID=A0A1G4UP97_9HYPH|nr:hypothetical protein [Ancylobacter rudongensis]SCW95470.1 hypothetical protein SAMN05660859_0036 [Ancylobacter rudongensis]
MLFKDENFWDIDVHASSECCELFLRELGLHLETSCCGNDEGLFYLTEVAIVPISSGIIRLSEGGVDPHRTPISYHRHTSLPEVHAFYLTQMQLMKAPEVDI